MNHVHPPGRGSFAGFHSWNVVGLTCIARGLSGVCTTWMGKFARVWPRSLSSASYVFRHPDKEGNKTPREGKKKKKKGKRRSTAKIKATPCNGFEPHPKGTSTPIGQPLFPVQYAPYRPPRLHTCSLGDGRSPAPVRVSPPVFDLPFHPDPR
jgi:hypothetical protein